MIKRREEITLIQSELFIDSNISNHKTSSQQHKSQNTQSIEIKGQFHTQSRLNSLNLKNHLPGSPDLRSWLSRQKGSVFLRMISGFKTSRNSTEEVQKTLEIDIHPLTRVSLVEPH